MAFIANYTDSENTFNDVTIRLGRIWGSKTENWNAWVDVFENATSEAKIATFAVNVKYVEGENPYPVLYKAASELLHFTNVVHDDSTNKLDIDNTMKFDVSAHSTVVPTIPVISDAPVISDVPLTVTKTPELTENILREASSPVHKKKKSKKTSG